MDTTEEAKDPTTGLTNTQKRAIEETWAIVFADVGTNGLELFIRYVAKVKKKT